MARIVLEKVIKDLKSVKVVVISSYVLAVMVAV